MSPSVAGAACIDWAGGQVLGFALPATDDVLYERVTLTLDGLPLVSAVANRSVFELGEAWASLPVPAREQSGFALRIPQRRLLPSHLSAAPLTLAVQDSQGRCLLETSLAGGAAVLALTDGAPVDLLYEVHFQGVEGGSLLGEVRDRLGLGHRPPLCVRFNEGPAQPVPWLGEPAEAGVHRFEIPLAAESLQAGANLLQLTGREGQPLASYPIRLGAAFEGDPAQRLQALETEVQFLKRLLLSPPEGGTGAAPLDLLKSEIVGICSEMLGMQRIHLEREIDARLRLALAAAEPSPPADSTP
ncbi:hypothetical protein KGA65_01840 [Ideonella sp. B7]|uniref:hypothetical protein n=1 Tax=Ideonella benzenivorans TaxID=2831643 RepID=UPI001CED0E27|nr:hypothetical protein [Ideonella benzenivorans]MCA6215273.1 hypothetical protein [Ideonella benzenivorans]